ncbi:hypothetical protein [Vibrio owensii]|uniref:hypothetical protein n=1 Tax=Vibrio owensii TaxID=696485 RepID=UPI0018F16423|nr:hypothetical protein [Vibrio owensii]
MKGIPSKIKKLIGVTVLGLSSLYYVVLETPRYESFASVVVKESDSSVSPSFDLGPIMGQAGDPSRKDLMQVKEYLYSPKFIDQVVTDTKLAEHYEEHYVWSFITGVDNRTLRDFYREVVRVEFDEYSGFLLISSQAFTPQKAKEIVELQLKGSEDFVNEIGYSIANKEKKFAHDELVRFKRTLAHDQSLLNAFQAKHNMLSIEGQAKVIEGAQVNLQQRISEAMAERASKSAFLKDDSFEVAALDAAIADLKKQQVALAQALASSSDEALSSKIEKFQDLMTNVEISAAGYRSALVAYEKVSIESYRQIKHVVVLSTPVEGLYSVYPNVFKSIFTVNVLALALLFISSFVLASLRESSQ